jgi:hypothetical protein
MVYLSSVASGRRPTKFTPERIEQIKDLVARGVDHQEIARLLGVTMGSLQVTCSRLGISLRRPRVLNGSRLLPLRAKTRVPARANTATATFSVCLHHNGKEQAVEVPLTPKMVGQLALEAASRNQRISELAKDLLLAVTEKGLIDEVLKE